MIICMLIRINSTSLKFSLVFFNVIIQWLIHSEAPEIDAMAFFAQTSQMFYRWAKTKSLFLKISLKHGCSMWPSLALT